MSRPAKPIPYRLTSSASSADFTVHLSAADLDRLAGVAGAWEDVEREHTGMAARPSPGALCTALVVRALRSSTPEELAALLWHNFVET